MCFQLSFQLSQFVAIFMFQHIDNVMSGYGDQIMQAVVFILEGEHSVDIKEQVTQTISSLFTRVFKIVV